MVDASGLPLAVLHIGTEKTGTTTIQRFLGENRELLLTKGVLYPRAPANRYHNHIGLAAYAARDDRYDDLRHHLEVTDRSQLERYREELRVSLAREVEEARGQARTVVLSNEHCHSRLATSEEVQRLADLLRPLFDDVSVVLYLRRQDRMAVSLYSTYLRHGGTKRDMFPAHVPDRTAHYYDFERLLDTWSGVFGERSVKPRIYEESSLNGGDVLQDFMAVLGTEVSSEYSFPPRLNESFSPAAQEVVRYLNSRAAQGDERLHPEALRFLVAHLAVTFAGKGRRPCRGAALEFYEKFRASNERVRKLWFPDRTSLFDEDFAGYPEVDDVDALTFIDAADLFIGAQNWLKPPA